MEVQNKNILLNLSTSKLYKIAINDEDLQLSSTGALLAYSGEKTGRSPKDKRIVLDENTKDIWWQSEDNFHGKGSEIDPEPLAKIFVLQKSEGNMPMDPELFKFYKECIVELFETVDRLFVVDAYSGWDTNYRIKIRVYCTCSYHALFMTNMLIPSKEKFDKPDFVIYNCGVVNLNIFTNVLEDSDLVDSSLNDTLVGLNFTTMEMIIFGTEYAGEMKKGILTLMMYLMPLQNNLPLHSSANVDKDDKKNVSLFFGLDGTGKTSLSTDPNRYLIGDDEHVWTDNGLFNIEGGCYAKCIDLKESSEPEIFRAIRYGAVLENVVYKEHSHIVDFDDTTITQNTRCSYPLDHIPNSLIPAKIDYYPNNIILLTCDAFGVLPPVCKLTPEQTVYFFVNGYTSKIAGTEVGIKEPQATFSACFGEPFLVWNPLKYGELLKEKINKYNSNIWMLNTGWIRGPYGVGNRISIEYTRCLLDNIHNGELVKQEFIEFPLFGFKIPTSCPNIETEILNPINMWDDKNSYMEKLEELYNKFEENYRKKLCSSNNLIIVEQ